MINLFLLDHWNLANLTLQTPSSLKISLKKGSFIAPKVVGTPGAIRKLTVVIIVSSCTFSFGTQVIWDEALIDLENKCNLVKIIDRDGGRIISKFQEMGCNLHICLVSFRNTCIKGIKSGSVWGCGDTFNFYVRYFLTHAK